MIPEIPNPLISTEEAAEILGLEPATLVNWRCTRRYPLPFVRIGRSIRYRLSDLELFIEKNVFGQEEE